LGCQKKKTEVLQGYTRTYHNAIKQSSPTSSEGCLSYFLYPHSNLQYPLSCTLTLTQCQMIQAPTLVALLPKLHLIQHSLMQYSFVSAQYGELDQGLEQLTFFIGHLKLDDDSGKIIWSLISHLQVFIGSATPILFYSCLSENISTGLISIGLHYCGFSQLPCIPLWMLKTNGHLIFVASMMK
jgi:hypothetical protein